MDPAALAKMVVTIIAALQAPAAAAAARADRRLPLVRQEQFPLAVLAAQGELQALGVLELQRVHLQPLALTAAAAAVGLVPLLTPSERLGVQFR